jgi:hypothetical protein
VIDVRCLPALLFLIVSSLALPACDGGLDRFRPENVLRRRCERERADLLERRARIEREISEAGAPAWAGRFGWSMSSCFGPYGEDVVLAPKGGIVWIQDASEPRWNHGEIVAVDGDRIRVRWCIDPRRFRTSPEQTEGALSDELFVVRWGTQELLVPRDRMIEVCNRANGAPDTLAWGGSLPQRVTPGVPLGAPEEGRTGWPAIPAEFEGLLHRTPAEFRIVEIGAESLTPRGEELHEASVLVEIDGGSENGLAVGARLYLTGSTYEANVVDLDASTAQVRIRAYSPPTREWRRGIVTLGARLSTGR